MLLRRSARHGLRIHHRSGDRGDDGGWLPPSLQHGLHRSSPRRDLRTETPRRAASPSTRTTVAVEADAPTTVDLVVAMALNEYLRVFTGAGAERWQPGGRCQSGSTSKSIRAGRVDWSATFRGLLVSHGRPGVTGAMLTWSGCKHVIIQSVNTLPVRAAAEPTMKASTGSSMPRLCGSERSQRPLVRWQVDSDHSSHCTSPGAPVFTRRASRLTSGP